MPLTIDTMDIIPVLRAMDGAARIIVVEAPPGAGKTFLVGVAVAHAIERGSPPIVVANSYEQVFGAVKRVTGLFPRIRPMIFASKTRKDKDFAKATAIGFDWGTTWGDVAAAIKQRRPIFTVVSKVRISKLNDEGENEHIFPWMILDEAWQVTDAEFALLAPLADRFLMVGDRGQIQPIVTTDASQWRNDPMGPHVAAPEAIMIREYLKKDVVRVPMTCSRRLPQRTVEIVQPIFYQTLPFSGAQEERSITQADNIEDTPSARILSEAYGERPAGFVPVLVVGNGRRDATDLGILNAMADLAETICQTTPTLRTGNEERLTTPEDIVLLVTRNHERRFLQQRLANWPGITIATANKFQGSERAFAISLHPLSGKTRTTDFDLESGRLCVVLSRHTHACFVFHREGISELIEKRVPNSARALGSSIDHAFNGWLAHRKFSKWMNESGTRIIHGNNLIPAQTNL